MAFLLIVVLVPPAAGFYSYFSGIPLHLLAGKAADNESSAASAPQSVSLVPGQPHTLQVPEEVSTALGIRKGQRDVFAIAEPPTRMRPIVLPGSTALDPTRLARIRARFAPAKVVEIAQVWDHSPKTGQTEFRELRQGDSVSKGDLLGIFYSADVGIKKNDLLDALVQLELDQRILDEAEKHAEAVPAVFLNTYSRAVQGDRNAISRALNNLKLWDIPQNEIDALHAEAKKISADKNAWFKSPEGRWVKGLKQANGGKVEPDKETENPWGRVTLRSPFDGVVVERNVHTDEMVVDNTVNLFQIADVNRLLVIASCPEDDLPELEDLRGSERRWTVRTVGVASATGLSGTIDEIGYVIDPNQHTAVIKGYVDNPGKRLRAGQYVTATVNIPPPNDVVEIPTDALVDDGLQSLVFVQPDPAVRHFTMRRVEVTQRFEHTVFVRNTPIPKEEQLTAHEAEEGLLPKAPLQPGERVLLSGTLELKAALLELESRPAQQPTDRVAKAKTRPAAGLESQRVRKAKLGTG
ncbi:efflux RND transporter periplasmic adaptor subunit [Singulisphaera sp. GP187]|uniref:efflux RND transporter periplasmic adaptor subunit n=1 Tax=Singulisphaera sp. GP187 TaxID=1882752 RepID=UPI0020B106CC|nr:efflux RND transporter periplasmic adaptor subunit [Singulisphaera sp. GP187]